MAIYGRSNLLANWHLQYGDSVLGTVALGHMSETSFFALTQDFTWAGPFWLSYRSPLQLV